MDNKTELENVKAEIESKREEKEKYEKEISSASKTGKTIEGNGKS